MRILQFTMMYDGEVNCQINSPCIHLSVFRL